MKIIIKKKKNKQLIQNIFLEFEDHYIGMNPTKFQSSTSYNPRVILTYIFLRYKSTFVKMLAR